MTALATMRRRSPPPVAAGDAREHAVPKRGGEQPERGRADRRRRDGGEGKFEEGERRPEGKDDAAPRHDDELGGQRGARRNEPGAKDEREERRRRAVDEGPEAQRLGGDGEGRKARARAALPEFGPQVHEQHDSDDDGHDPGGHRGRPDAAVEGGPRQGAEGDAAEHEAEDDGEGDAVEHEDEVARRCRAPRSRFAVRYDGSTTRSGMMTRKQHTPVATAAAPPLSMPSSDMMSMKVQKRAASTPTTQAATIPA